MSRVRTLVVGLAVASMAFLTGCAGTLDPNQIAGVIAQIQQDAAAICSIVPAATDVATLLSGQDKNVVNASQVANTICSAFTSQTKASLVRRHAIRRGSTQVVNVNGVQVHVVVR